MQEEEAAAAEREARYEAKAQDVQVQDLLSPPIWFSHLFASSLHILL